MQRTRRTPKRTHRTTPANEGSEYSYPIEDEPLILFKPTYDRILHTGKGAADSMWLYLFYYQQAKWHKIKTTRIWATTNYVANGLGWPIARVRRAKKALIELGLVEDFKLLKKGTNIIHKHLIKIRFISFGNANTLSLPDESTDHPNDFPPYGDLHGVGKSASNALITKKENALNTEKETALNRSNFLGKEKEQEKIPEEYTEFSQWFLEAKRLSHGKQAESITPTLVRLSVDVLDKLVRLDGFDFQAEVVPVIKWAMDNDFWSGNLFSLARLRKKSKTSGNKKFISILRSYTNSQKKPTPEVSRRALAVCRIFMDNEVGTANLNQDGSPRNNRVETQLQELLDYHGNIMYPGGPGTSAFRARVESQIGDPNKFIQRYCEWINNGSWIKQPKTISLGVSKPLISFMEELAEDYQWPDLAPKSW